MKAPGGFKPEKDSSGVDRYRIRCPAHGGEDLNAAVWNYTNKRGRPGVWAKCFSHDCDPIEILKALGVESRWDEAQKSREKNNDAFVCEYRHPDGEKRAVYRLDYPADFDAAKPCSFKDCGKTEPHKHMWGKKSPKGCFVLLWGDDKPDNVCVLVEGEKTAQALVDAGANEQGYTPVTWRGGSSTAEHANYTPLAGRRVICWPDKDAAGASAMDKAGAFILDSGATAVRLIDPPEELPAGGDAADMKPADALATLKTAREWTPPSPPRSASVTRLRTPSTRIVSARDAEALDELLEQAASEQAESGQWLRLFGGWFQRVGNSWMDDTDENVQRVLSRALIESAGHRLARAHKADAADWLSDLVAPPADSPAVLDPSDRLRSFDLDTGEILPGAIFGEERIWLEGGKEIARAPVGERDFVRAARPYSLPDEPDDTPKWDAYLAKAFEEPEDGAALMESIGITLAGYTGYQVAIALRGLGRSGKGVALDFLISALGGASRVASFPSPSSLRGFGSSDIQGKSAVIFPDMPGRPKGSAARADWDEGLGILKSIIGEDVIRTERKYKDGLSSRIDALSWMATNYNLEFAAGASDASAWSERLRIHAYEHIVPREERIPHYGQILFEEEGPSIALKCLRAAAEAGERGALTITDSMRRETREAMDDAIGEVSEFVEKHLRYGDGEFISRARIREALSAHLKRKAHNGEVSSMNALIENRPEGFVRGVHRGGERGWHGVALASDPPLEPPTPTQASMDDAYCAGPDCGEFVADGQEYCEAHEALDME